jgi:tRNA A-37 threonylcarbamoyl transferase component Bud32/tetratricopeptide (TPR) repeat protein
MESLGDRLERELGRGGMATVYLAEDLKHSRRVAIKVLKAELAASLGAERFLREIAIAANLKHPNILMLIDSGEADGFLYYVMPYVAGESLRARLTREHQLPMEDVAEIARQVAEALAHAHGQEVIHRDIKPGNILLENGHAIVVDFGIARAVTTAGGEKLTETGIAVGTPTYMSPEQASGSGIIDRRTDIYALGCVVYEMLGGDPPFTGSTPQAILARQVMDTVPTLRAVRRAVPPATQAVVEKALEKSPADRFASAEEFGSAFGTSLTGQWVVGRRPERAWYRRPVVWLAPLAALAVAALTLGITWSGGGGAAIDADRTAVAVLENQTGDPSLDALGRLAAEGITQGIQQRGVATVVPTEVALAAAEGARSRRDPVGAFARATGAGVVLHGAYYLIGDSVQFQVQITDAAAGELLSALAPVTGSRVSPTAALGLVRERVAAGLAAALDLRAGVLPFPMQPPSLEVYRVFRQAVVNDTPFQDEQLRLYQEAWAMDSSFHPALLMIAKELRWLERDAESDSVARIADGYRDRMSEAERLYSQLYQGEDAEAHMPMVRRLVELVPAYWTYWAAWAAWRAYRPREALEYFTGVDTTKPNITPDRKLYYWMVGGRGHHMLGQYEEELETLRAGRREFPDDLRLVDGYTRALAALGRIDELNAFLDTLFALPAERVPGGFRAVDLRAWVAADQLRAHGHRDAARQVLGRTIDWIEERPPEESAQFRLGSYYTYSLAECLYRLERWEEARAMFEGLLAENPEAAHYLGPLGVIAARLGNHERVRAYSELLAKRPGGQPGRRASIAALLGEHAEAVRLLRASLNAGMDRGRWREGNWGFDTELRHRDMDLESLRGYAPFEQLMRPRG